MVAEGPNVPPPQRLPITFGGRDYDALVLQGYRERRENPGQDVGGTVYVEIPADEANLSQLRSAPAFRGVVEGDPGKLVATLELRLTAYDLTRFRAHRGRKPDTYEGPRLKFTLDGERDTTPRKG